MKNNKFALLLLGLILGIAGVLCMADTPVFTPGNASLSIQTGTFVNTANGTITNTFANAFSAVPNVVVEAVGTVQTTNWISAINATNFTFSGTVSVTNYYIAIGPR